VNLTGNWTQDAGGALCRVNQETNVIDFTNMSSPNIKGRGSFNGPYSIMMDGDFGGGAATVTSDGNEIHWANGIRWIRRR
jgi:hypothetical protein